MPGENQDAVAVFHAALERSDPEERRRFLDQACGGSAELREQVQQLLEADAQADDFFDSPESADVTRKPKQRPDPEGPGTVIDRYKILQLIAEGGFGSVYMAEQSEPVKRRVALKVIKLGMDTKQVIARFEAERQALAMMDHPNIAKVFDAGTTESGRPYFVMELVPGTAITEYCDKNQLNTKERLDLFVQVCDAVQHAHQKGIIHRDIKPSNVLVTLHNGKPLPMVIDFGIAKATGKKLTEKTLFTNFSQMIGTPAYMSPEQAEMTMQDVDTRTDIYSLGVLLYQLLTGTQPFSQKELLSKGYAEMQRIIAEVEPPRLSTRLGTMEPASRTLVAQNRGMDVAALQKVTRGDLDWIAMKCLEKDRRRRYETVNGLAADITHHLANEPVLARPPSQLYRFQKMVRRNKATAFAVGSVVTALVLGLGLAMAALVREQEARQRELKETIRATTVGTFVEDLLWDALPSMIGAGNVLGARELATTADALASSSLSNAPAAEIRVRYILRRVHSDLFQDPASSLLQAEAILRLLPAVPDSQLNLPRQLLRVQSLAAQLAAASQDGLERRNAMDRLDGVYRESLAQTPQDNRSAMICRYEQGGSLYASGTLDQAEAKLADAYRLLPDDPASDWWRHRTPALYVTVLVEREKWSQAEQVARESLKTPPGAQPEAWEGYVSLLEQMSHILCTGERFKEATAILEEQRRLLIADNGPEGQLVRIDVLRGAVLARSGNAREALPFLETVAAHRLSSTLDWQRAANLAAAAGDPESHQRLCRIGLLRFASSAEGHGAASLAWGLLSRETDETTLAVAHAMVDRVADSEDWSIEFIDWLRSGVAHRERNYAESLRLLDQFQGTPPPGRASRAFRNNPGDQANVAFVRAALSAELGRTNDALRDFAQGQEQLNLVLGEKPTQDRGRIWWGSYNAESARREAKEVFRAKGIPLPESATR